MECSSHLSHPLALFGTPPASLGAALAMIHFVLGAFICACLANIRAQVTKRLSEIAAPGHITGCQATNLSAIHIQFYTARHTVDVLFRET